MVTAVCPTVVHGEDCASSACALVPCQAPRLSNQQEHSYVQEEEGGEARRQGAAPVGMKTLYCLTTGALLVRLAPPAGSQHSGKSRVIRLPEHCCKGCRSHVPFGIKRQGKKWFPLFNFQFVADMNV